ncbi:related to Acetoacetyl-CoA synthetase [Sporisorium reilianum SRZ2]|uniref:Related to Acetoacetyl-CoA synthetase n=1 Tax=Sporisorium reilianum (strain SRZ2) TaxID=999809 RepID=E6ZK34_SPORE|nr:related to Acetoacetyl-CoA synthetase [Sporisorium reilianum SRZ2]
MTTPTPAPSQPLVWSPTPDEIQRTSLDKFRRVVNARFNLELNSYDDLHDFSISRMEDFWATVWDFAGIRASTRFERVLSDPEALPGDLPEWFPGASFSMAQNVLFPLHPANTTFCSPKAPYHWPHAQAVALIEVPEGGGLAGSDANAQAVKVTWGELRRRVALLAETFRRIGVKKGDRLAHVSANTASPIVATLAANSVGAIYSLIATDAGPQAIYGRLAQIRPKLLFTDDAVLYNGKQVDILDRVAHVAERLQADDKIDSPLSFQVVIIRNARLPNTSPRWTSTKVRGLEMDAFITQTGLHMGDSPAHRFEQLRAQHPVQIFFSSGTTGEPKCIIHTQCMLLNMKKEALLMMDLQPADTFLQITSCGWIMWLYHLVALSVGSTAVLYDGSPMFPNPAHVVKVVSHLKCSGYGASPRFLSELEKFCAENRFSIARQLELGKFRMMTSTGSPLSPKNVDFFYSHFPKRAHLCSISGGTDMAGVLVGPTKMLPLYGNFIQCKALGFDIQVWDAETGERIDETGKPGELIVAKPFPTQLQALYEKYMDSYYARFPGRKVWAQGDFIYQDTATKGLEILGRSDGVLNPSGVRFGSSEIYSVVEKFEFVGDSIVVGQRRPGKDEHERVLLFIKMRDPAATLDGTHIAQLNSAIKAAYSARHVPEHTFQVHDIPVTLNGKKTELAVKAVVNGNAAFKPSSATANPQSLAEYAQYADLEAVVAARSGARAGAARGGAKL